MFGSIEHTAQTYSFQSTLTKNWLVNRIYKGDCQKCSNAYFKCIFTVFFVNFRAIFIFVFEYERGTLLTWLLSPSQDLIYEYNEEILKKVIINHVCL